MLVEITLAGRSMSFRQSSRLIRAALAACLAVVTTMPPAMGHAHAGGDRPHQHEHDGHHHSDRHHSDHSHADHGHGPSARPVIASAGWGTSEAGRFAHVHFAWLGLEVTLAWPVGAAGAGDGQADHIVVRLLDSAAQGISQVDVQSPFVASGCWAVLPAATVWSSPPSATALLRSLQTEAPATTLLCDSARHERSGVQLS